jgi:cytochrome c oxidase assembly protein subunit 15
LSEVPGTTSPTGAGLASRLPTVSPTVFRRLSIANLVMVALIVVSGAAVRLTGSGLGCTDWPDCTHGHLTPPLRFHSLVEFGNRMVTVLLVVVVAATVLAALRRRPFRRDLAWLSAGLVGGVLLQAVMGGIVVYTKLNPYVVMVHFLASMPLVVDAVVLLHRSTRDYSPGSGRLLVPRPIHLLSRGLVLLLALVLAAGSATTGASPDGGSSQGQVRAKRIPVSLQALAELHADLALFLVGFALALAVALHAIDVPERVRRAGRMLVGVLVLQAGVGYAQYFTHLPAALVELHVAGATVLVIGTTQFLLALTYHAPEPVAVPEPTATTVPASAGPARSPAPEGVTIG